MTFLQPIRPGSSLRISLYLVWLNFRITTSLADTLPSSVPKPDAVGLNWAVFTKHFKDAADVKGSRGHLDRSTSRHRC